MCSPPAWPTDFQLACPHNCVSQFLKINLLHTHAHTHTPHTHVFLWRTLTDAYCLHSPWSLASTSPAPVTSESVFPVPLSAEHQSVHRLPTGHTGKGTFTCSSPETGDSRPGFPQASFSTESAVTAPAGHGPNLRCSQRPPGGGVAEPAVTMGAGRGRGWGAASCCSTPASDCHVGYWVQCYKCFPIFNKSQTSVFVKPLHLKIFVNVLKKTHPAGPTKPICKTDLALGLPVSKFQAPLCCEYFILSPVPSVLPSAPAPAPGVERTRTMAWDSSTWEK